MHILSFGLLLLASLPSAGWSAPAISAGQVATLHDQGERLLIVDVRSPQAFAGGHVPGAINIPMRGLQHRSLPPVSRVVVYDEGLGTGDANRAASLIQDQGIQPLVLSGGYAGWTTQKGLTTQGAGLSEPRSPKATYDTLLALDDPAVVMVDLRDGSPLLVPGQKPGQRSSQSAVGAIDADDVVIEVSGQVAGGAALTTDPFAAVPSRNAAAPAQAGGLVSASAGDAPLPLIVLIDDGDGRAESTAARLRGAGYHRVLVVAGGAQTLEFQGRTGLERASSLSVEVPANR